MIIELQYSKLNYNLSVDSDELDPIVIDNCLRLEKITKMKVGESSMFRLVCPRLEGISYYTMYPIHHIHDFCCFVMPVIWVTTRLI